MLAGGGTLGVVLTYPREPELVSRIAIGLPRGRSPRPEAASPTATSRLRGRATPTPGLGLIGAGNFATGVLLPLLPPGSHLRRVGVATASGLSARSTAERFGFAYCTSRYQDLLEDADVDAVLVATRHDLHARIAAEALSAGKAVFVEKPLALAAEELEQVVTAWEARPGLLMVGFNRRHSPACTAARDHFRDRTGPLSLTYRINAGALAETSWLLDPQEGGGRILGEVCHFVDTLQFLVGSPAESVFAVPLGHGSGSAARDTIHAVLRYPDGSIGSIQYTTDGDPDLPKERIELSAGGATAVIEEFRGATLSRSGKRRHAGGRLPDKGHAAELAMFQRLVEHGDAGAADEPECEALFRDAVAATITTLGIVTSARTGERVVLR
jgi:predicted dehydrogenase